MADFGPLPSETMDTSAVSASAFLTQPNVDTAPTTGQGIRDVPFVVPTAIVGAVDTMYSSLPFTDDKTFGNAIASLSPEWGDYYQNRAEGARLVGDIVGSFVPGMAAIKGFSTGAKALVGMEKLPGLAAVARYTYGAEATMAAHRARAMSLASAKALNFTSDAGMKALRTKAIMQGITKGVAESLAFDAGVYAAMNSSEHLFPDEMSMMDHVKWTSGFAVIGGGVEGLFAWRGLRKNLLAAAARYPADPANTKGIDPIFRPGQRDVGVVTNQLGVANAEDALAGLRAKPASETTEFDTKFATNLNAEILKTRETIRGQIAEMGKDVPIPILTHKFVMDKAHINTVEEALRTDPTTLLGVNSIEKPMSKEAFEEWKIAREDKVAKIDEAIEALQTAQSNADDVTAFNKEITKLVKEKFTLLRTEPLILENTGEVIPAAMRFDRFTDDFSLKDIKVVPGNAKELPNSYTLDVPMSAEDGLSRTRKFVIGMTQDGNILLPEPPKNMLAGQAINRLLDSIEAGQKMDHSKLLLDIAEDYHYELGVRGKKIFESLDYDIRDQIGVWTSSSRASHIRRWAENNDPRYGKLYAAYQDFRDKISELAAPDGTIALFRGVADGELDAIKRGASNEIDDVVSFSTNPKVAAGFGDGKVLEYRIPVEDIVMPVGGAGHEYEFIVKNHRLRSLDNGTPLTQTTTKNFEALTTKQITAVYAMMQKAIDDGFKRQTPFAVHKGNHWTKYDMAAEIIAKNGGTAPSWLRLPDGWTVKDIEFAALAGKYREFNHLMNVVENKNLSPAFKAMMDKGGMNMPEIIARLNLPASTDGSITPMLEAFTAFRHDGITELNHAVSNLDELTRILDDKFVKLDGVKELAADHMYATRGSQLSANLENKPVTLMREHLETRNYTRNALEDRALMLREATLQTLRNAHEGGIVKAAMSVLDDNPAVQQAMRVEELAEGIMRGRGVIGQQSFAAGDSPTLSALITTMGMVDKQGRRAFAEMVKPFANAAAKVRANKADTLAVDMFVNARRMAWDLKAEAVNDGGKWQFPLRDTAANKKRWQKLFNSPMPEDAMMPVGFQTTPVALSDDAFQMIDALRNIGASLRNDANTINRAMGRSDLNIKEWWIPPKNLANVNTVVVIDQAGGVSRLVEGRTVAEAQRRAEEFVAERLSAGEKLSIVSRSDVERYNDFLDEAFDSKLHDFSDPLNQTGKATGGTATTIIPRGEAVIDEITTALNRNAESIMRRTRSLYMEPAVAKVRTMRELYGGDEKIRGTSVWDKWLEQVYGTTNIPYRDMHWGSLYRGMENFYDARINGLMDYITNSTGRQGVLGAITNSDQRLYKQWEKDYAAFNPFKDTNDFLEKTYRITMPHSMKVHMAKLSSLTATLALRFMEVGHAILNTTSLATTMPAVISNLTRYKDEPVDLWRRRIGAFGDEITEDVAMPNFMKVVSGAIHEHFNNPAFREEIARASKAGYFDQEVAEMFKTITEPREGYAQHLLDRYGKWTTWLSDTSEKMARGVAFSTGLYTARRLLGMKNDKAVWTFAQKFADDVIGNYRPTNRPHIFRGAVGMPLGLFMTFSWNYYQRLFGYIENKAFRTLAVQYATQASVFGAQSVPGWDAYNNFFFSNYDGSQTPTDAFEQKLGRGASDLFLYGSLANIPKLFGGDGIAMHTRGDMNMIRAPGLLTWNETPAATLISNAYNTISESFKSLKTNGGFNTRQLAEIAAQYSINRSARSMIELAQGYSVDRRGQMVEANVHSPENVIARILGFRGLQEQKKRDYAYRIRTTEFHQQQLMAQLRSAVRASARGDGLDNDALMTAVTNYVRAGGNPQYFTRFLMTQSLAGTQEKTALQLMKLMKSPQSSEARDIMLLMSLGSDDTDILNDR